jgi:hypothetical protein
MGLGSYFKAQPQPQPQRQEAVPSPDPSSQRTSETSQEKANHNGIYGSPRDHSRMGSRTSLSSQRSSMMEEIRHEVMVNYLFQQQCTRTWIDDTSGASEGVILRKERAQFLACPPALLDSEFGRGCFALNLQAAMTINSRLVSRKKHDLIRGTC